MSKIKVDQLETLDGTVTVSVAGLGAGGGGVTDHGGLTGLADDDHPQYHTDARGDARYSQLGHGHAIGDVAGLQVALDGKQDTLVSGTNIKTINGNSLLGSGDITISGGGGGGVTDHGALTGLADDDHPQYHTDARGDARYSQLGHTHAVADVTGLQTALDGKAASNHTHTASQISDSTTVGRAVLTAADAAAARAAIGAGTGNGDVTLTGAQSISGKTVFSFGSQFNAGNSGTAVTVNFANGQKQLLTLTGNATVTLSFPGVGNYQILLVQDATGNRTVTWSGVTRWVGSATAPAINTAANSSTVVSIYYDGTNVWLGASKVNA